MKKAVVLLLFPLSFFLSTSSMAQDLKVSSAFGQTRCSGAAGKCCTKFDIHLYPYNKDIVIDSLYLNTQSIKLGQPKGYVVTDTIQHAYTIIVFETELEARELTEPLRHHTGEPGDALIIYEYKGKPYTLVVKTIKGRPSDDKDDKAP